MSKKAIKAQLTITEEKETKRATSDPACLYAFKSNEISPACLDKWEEELRAFPKAKPKAKFIREFYQAKGWKKSTYFSLIARQPQLKEAHEDVMEELGDRLWGRSVDRQAHWESVKHRLHRYGPEFKEDDLHAASLRKIESLESSQGLPFHYHAPDYRLTEEGKPFAIGTKGFEENKNVDGTTQSLPSPSIEREEK